MPAPATGAPDPLDPTESVAGEEDPGAGLQPLPRPAMTTADPNARTSKPASHGGPDASPSPEGAVPRNPMNGQALRDRSLQGGRDDEQADGGAGAASHGDGPDAGERAR